MKYKSAVKRNQWLIYAATWMNLEGIMLSGGKKKKQSPKVTYCMTSFTEYSQNNQVKRWTHQGWDRDSSQVRGGCHYKGAVARGSLWWRRTPLFDCTDGYMNLHMTTWPRTRRMHHTTVVPQVWKSHSKYTWDVTISRWRLHRTFLSILSLHNPLKV